MRSPFITMSLMLTVIGSASLISAQSTTPRLLAPDQTSVLLEDLAATEHFAQGVTAYVMLHRLLEGPLPPLQTSQDMRVVHAAMDALAKQIQTARQDAQLGDLFPEDVVRVFRRRIAACLAPEDLEAILVEHQESDPASLPPVRVNAIWPAEVAFNFVPPQLLAALPPLPPELQYRIIGRSLVLWDHHANLIVDVLPGAFTS